MKLIIVRHGETEENIKEILMGHQHGKITERGKEQAKKLALRLKDEKIDLIFSSDLQRAKDTTKEIAKYHRVPVYYTPELREMYFGILEGSPVEEYYKALKESVPETEFKPEGGEGFAELRERAQKFLDKLFEKYKDKTILVSSHGLFNVMLLGILLKKPIEEALELGQANACVNIVEVSENSEHKAHLINCIMHL